MRHQKTLLGLLSQDDTIEQVRDAAREFARKEIAPLDLEVDQTNRFPAQLWPMLGSINLLGVTIPEEYDGVDLGYLAHLVVMEEISRASGSIGLSYIADTNLGMNQINLNGTHEQKKRYLPPLVAGEKHAALAMSEANAGSDVMAMKLNAVKVNDGWRLTGTKQWITNGGTADVLVVYAKTDPAAGKDGITAFLVEKDMHGFMPGKKENKEGMRGSETYELVFDNCFIPDENVLGEVNKGRAVLTSGLNYERLLLSGGPLGLAQASIDRATEHLNQRIQFGAPLIQLQTLAHEIARMQSRILMARHYAYSAAAQADEGTLSHDTAASVFFETSDMAHKVTQHCMTLCGGMGYTRDMALGRYHRDALLYEIGGGARHIRLMLIANRLGNNGIAEKFQMAAEHAPETGVTRSLHEALRVAQQSLRCAVEHVKENYDDSETALTQRLAELRSNLLMGHHFVRSLELVPDDEALAHACILEVNDIAVKVASECLEIADNDCDSTFENNLSHLHGMRRDMGRRHEHVEALALKLLPGYAKHRLQNEPAFDPEIK